uniref:Prolactin n=1 Tax=Cavia porcellus TaxID=10141 RepID=A0A286XAS7_CAVPO
MNSRSRLMLLLMSTLFLRTDYQTTLPHLVQHTVTVSNYIHVLTSELYQDFITLYSLDRDFYFKNMKSCHTASVTTILDKKQILKMKEDMILLVICLLCSCDNPLSHHIAQLVYLPKIPQKFMKKAELIQEKMYYLLESLEIMARQVGFQVTNYADYAVWTELPSLQPAEGEDLIDTFHHLCHCFLRDISQVSHDRHN